jgi:MauM/NapG family ferredoxin protein
MGRRSLLAAGISAIPALLLGVRLHHKPPPVVRPPGALPEEQFIGVCTRCGQCFKVCPTNFLQPTLFESGIEGIFTPTGNPLRGYCEYECTLCGQVCPTEAIAELTKEQKRHTKIGIAKFVEETCLPFAEKTNCIVCEEHCPIPGKAIRLEPTGQTAKDGQELRKPYVVADLCTGCGICVAKCPVKGRRGIELYPLPRGF